MPSDILLWIIVLSPLILAPLLGLLGDWIEQPRNSNADDLQQDSRQDHDGDIQLAA